MNIRSHRTRARAAITQETGAPLSGAVGIAGRRQERTTGSDRTVVIDTVQGSPEVRLCASHREFEARCLPDAAWVDDRKHVIELARKDLEPGVEATIGTDTPLVGARGVYVDPHAGTTQSVRIGDDGNLKLPVLVHDGYPLKFMMRTGPVSNFGVTSPGTPDVVRRMFTLRVDGATIPLSLFGFRQSMRGLQPVLFGSGPAVVGGIRPGRIEVVAGPLNGGTLPRDFTRSRMAAQGSTPLLATLYLLVLDSRGIPICRPSQLRCGTRTL